MYCLTLKEKTFMQHLYCSCQWVVILPQCPLLWKDVNYCHKYMLCQRCSRGPKSSSVCITVLHSDIFGHVSFLRLRIGQFSDTPRPPVIVAECQKYLMFQAFGKVYLCLLKIFLFLSICRLYFIQFLHEIYMGKVL